jgi:hypothetical protein
MSRAAVSGVYFVQANEGGPIKIGVAIDVRRRLSGLQNGSPMRLHVLGVVPGDRRLEVELHGRFAADRLHGEWFRETEALFAYINENSVAEWVALLAQPVAHARPGRRKLGRSVTVQFSREMLADLDAEVRRVRRRGGRGSLWSGLSRSDLVRELVAETMTEWKRSGRLGGARSGRTTAP